MEGYKTNFKKEEKKKIIFSLLKIKFGRKLLKKKMKMNKWKVKSKKDWHQ